MKGPGSVPCGCASSSTSGSVGTENSSPLRLLGVEPTESLRELYRELLGGAVRTP